MRSFLVFSLFLSGFALAFDGCKSSEKSSTDIFGRTDLNYANTKLLDIAMEDGFPPPIASRVYVYPHIAHYLTLQSFYPDSLPALSTRLNGMPVLSFPAKEGVDGQLASLLAYCQVARKVVFSEYMADDIKTYFTDKAASGGLSEATISQSQIYADSVASQLIKWINKDNYIQTRTMDRWTSTKKPGQWRETPPDYLAGLEPNWSKMRTLVADSASIYTATPPPAYSPDKNSDFFKMVNEVYENSKKLDSTKIATAWYWDDNPNVSEHRGHLVTVIHKISPPGHWLNIVTNVSSSKNSSIFTATKAYTFSAIAMFDGIISCWYEKYRTNLVRPVSYIQEFIDVEWQPLIQTPPFPEYTSGHSVLSAAAATVLGDIYGKESSFTDSTQVIFSLAPRTYPSFDEAAWEVSLSRFYGGIHYMNGISEGNKQGKFIGRYVLDKIHSK